MSNAVAVLPTHSAPMMSLDQVERVATAMARSGAFGVKDPHTALILCLLAQEEGRSPVAAARDYHVIQGTPAKKADAMLRDFQISGGRVEWHKLTDEECEATFSHPTGGTVTISWDKARVAQAQLGSNPMHKKYPRQMLRSRVVSEGVRTVYPGATSGLYVPEEVADFDNSPARTAPPTPVAQRARDLPAVEHQPEPEADWTDARDTLAKAAQDGTAALQAAWKGLGKEAQLALKPELDGFKEVAAQSEPETDAFGLSPLTEGPAAVENNRTSSERFRDTLLADIAAPGADLKAIDTDFVKNRTLLDDEHAAEVEAALSAARKAVVS